MKINQLCIRLPKKYLYLFIIVLLLVQLYNIQPLSSFKIASIEYKIHFILMGTIFWIFSAMFFYTARMYFLNLNKLYWVAAAIFCLLGICMLVLPFYIYQGMTHLDNAIQILDFKADSLRKAGK